MIVSINFNFSKIVEINNCIMFSTGQLMSFFFDKKSNRDYAKFLLEQSCCVKSMVEGDNSDYKDLPECYKLYVVPFCQYTINVKDDVIPNPFFLFDQYLGEGNGLFVLLKNETNKNPYEMEIIDICDKNKKEWSDNENYKDTIVVFLDKKEDKAEYLLRYARAYKF